MNASAHAASAAPCAACGRQTAWRCADCGAVCCTKCSFPADRSEGRVRLCLECACAEEHDNSATPAQMEA